MYEQDEDYAEEGEDSEELSTDIWQEACWIVISAYFDEKGRIKGSIRQTATNTFFWVFAKKNLMQYSNASTRLRKS